ncbi:MAG: hypothetical protein WCC10_11335 [Tumebacillaceae bacterium]
MTHDPKQEKPVEKKILKITEEEIEQALENTAKDVEEEGATINISCSI